MVRIRQAWVVVFLILSVFVTTGYAQVQFERGRIIDSVFTEDGKESFALYLPKDFDEKIEHPLILIFDPMARGSIGIEPFILSSETHGYVLACSNDSKNGPYLPNQAIAQRMFETVKSLFRIDKKRMYASGFSGGSRLASRLAMSDESIKGVIACGAGLPEGAEYQLLATRYPFAGIIGNKDMNYLEFQDLKRILPKMSFPLDVITTDLNHRWPEPESVLMATDWLQLEYYKAYPDKADMQSIEQGYHRAYEYVRVHESQGHMIESLEGYNRLLLNYRRHLNLDSISSKREALIDSRPYKSEKRTFDATLEEERRLTIEFWNQFNADLEDSKPDLKWWSKQMEKLDSKGGKDNRLHQNMSERTKYKIFAHALETAQFRTLPKAYGQKEFCYDLCVLIYPGYFYPYFRLMDLALEQGDPEKALDRLRIMIDNGFEDRNRLLSSKVGQQLRDNPEFTALVDKLDK